MINSKADLNKYLEMDKKALQRKENKPRLFGDDIWKYEIALRKHEYYVTCKTSFIKRFCVNIGHIGIISLDSNSISKFLQILSGGGVCIMHSGSIVVHPEA